MGLPGFDNRMLCSLEHAAPQRAWKRMFELERRGCCSNCFSTCRNRAFGTVALQLAGGQTQSHITRDPRNEKGVKVANSPVLPRIFRPCWFWQDFEISHFSHFERFPFHFLGIALGIGMISPNRKKEF